MKFSNALVWRLCLHRNSIYGDGISGKAPVTVNELVALTKTAKQQQPQQQTQNSHRRFYSSRHKQQQQSE